MEPVTNLSPAQLSPDLTPTPHPDQAMPSSPPIQADKLPAEQAITHSPKLNGPAKRGIAAAIAAFEKGPDKSLTPKAHTPILKKSVRALNNTSQPSPTRLKDPVGEPQAPAGDHQASDHKNPDPVVDHNNPTGDEKDLATDPKPLVANAKDPVADQMDSAGDKRHPAGNQPSAPAVKPNQATKALRNEQKPPLKKSEPTPAVKGHPRISNVNAAATTAAATNATAKALLRASVSVRTAPTRTVTKPTANPVHSPTAARRTSLLVNPTKPPLKSAGTAATTTPTAAAANSRKLPANNPAPPGRTAHSSLAPGKKLSTAPGATTNKTTGASPAALATDQSIAELETKLSQAQLDLVSKSEQLATLEAKLEELAKSADAEKEKLKSEIDSLNLKIEELANVAQAEAADSLATLDATKAEREAAKVRAIELEQVVNSHQQNQSDLSAKQAEALSQVEQLEELIGELKKQLEEANASKDAAMAEMSTQHSQELSCKLEEARLEFQAQKATLESRLKQLETDLENSEHETTAKFESTLSEEVRKKTEQVTTQHAEERERLNSLHASQLEAVTREHEAVLRNLRETFEAKVAEAEKAFADLKESTGSLESMLTEQHTQELLSAIEEAKNTVTKELESSISSIKQEHTAALAQLEAEITQVKEAKSALEQEQEKLKDENQALQADKQALEARLTSEIEALQAENATKLDQEYQRAKDELNESNIAQLKAFRQSSQESTDQLLLSHKAELDALKSALQSDFASEKTTIENELSQTKVELSALHSDLSTTRASHQDLSDQIDRLTAELETAKALLAESQAKLNEPVKSDELEELQQLLIKSEETLAEQKAEFERQHEESRLEFEHARGLHSTEITKHIEDRTLLEKELRSLKEQIESDQDRIKISHSLVEELGQTIEQEMKKREQVEDQLRQLQKSPGGQGPHATQNNKISSSTNANLVELHEAHNLKILELENEVDKWKDIAMKKEDETEEMKFRIKFLEDMIQKEDEDDDTEDNQEVEKNLTRDRHDLDHEYRSSSHDDHQLESIINDGDRGVEVENHPKVHASEETSIQNDFAIELAT